MKKKTIIFLIILITIIITASNVFAAITPMDISPNVSTDDIKSVQDVTASGIATIGKFLTIGLIFLFVVAVVTVGIVLVVLTVKKENKKIEEKVEEKVEE